MSTPTGIDALLILSGCPDGATAHALMVNKISPTTLRSLVREGFINVRRERQVTLKDMIITRYTINERGRSELHRVMEESRAN